jgi:hypothetical protein
MSFYAYQYPWTWLPYFHRHSLRKADIVSLLSTG